MRFIVVFLLFVSTPALADATVLVGVHPRDAAPPLSPGVRLVVQNQFSRWAGFSLRRFWWAPFVVRVVVAETPEARTAMENVGFRRPGELVVRVTIDRISNINGWGTDVNGERTATHAIAEAYELERSLDAVARLEAFHVTPWSTALASFASQYNAIFARWDYGGVFERGFRGRLSLSLCEVVDGREVRLFGSNTHTGYLTVQGDRHGDAYAPNELSVSCAERTAK